MPIKTLREQRLGHTATHCAWHRRVSQNTREPAREGRSLAGGQPGLSLSCFPPLPRRVAEDAREGARPSRDSSRRRGPPSLPPSEEPRSTAPAIPPAPPQAGSRTVGGGGERAGRGGRAASASFAASSVPGRPGLPRRASAGRCLAGHGGRGRRGAPPALPRGAAAALVAAAAAAAAAAAEVVAGPRRRRGRGARRHGPGGAAGERVYRAIKDLYLHEPEQMLWNTFPPSGRELSCTSRSQMPGEAISRNLQETGREKKHWECNTKHHDA